jgi:hypothetical protein
MTVLVFMNTLQIDQYFNPDPNNIDLLITADQVLEEYKRETLSKYKMPIISIVISIVAAIISIFNIFC